MVACAPAKQVVGQPGKRGRRQVKRPANVIIYHARMSGKSAISDNRFYIWCARAAHDRNSRAHRIGHNAQASPWHALLRVIYRAQKVSHLTIAKRDGGADLGSMPIIFKGQDIVPGLPEKIGDAQRIRFTAAITRTNEQRCSSFGIENKPATHHMFAVARRKYHRFGRQIKLKGSKGIIAKW